MTGTDAQQYERAIMEAGDRGEAPPQVEPPEGYMMSERFKAWLVDRMRAHVMEDVGAAGLDRMAIVKDGSEE